MRQPADDARVSTDRADSARLRQLFADAFGADVLSSLSLRLETLSNRNKQYRSAIAWTRLALSCDARPS